MLTGGASSKSARICNLMDKRLVVSHRNSLYKIKNKEKLEVTQVSGEFGVRLLRKKETLIQSEEGSSLKH